MFKHILIPLDGSTRAESAIPVAARIARASGGSVTLLRVVTTPVDFSWYAMESPIFMQGVLDADFDNATSYLATIAKSAVLAGVKTTPEVLTGSPALTIIQVSSSRKTDLIVMCSHGETGFKRWVLGSVAQKVARHSPVPVLVLREGETTLHALAPRPMRIMVPLDGSDLAETALEPAAQLCAALSAPTQGELHLARVLYPTEVQENNQPVVVTDTSNQIIADAKAYLSSVEQRFQQGDLAYLNLQATASFAFGKDVAEVLIEMAEDGEYLEDDKEVDGCDMIAMATHGRNGPEHWAMGSVSERVLGATRLPLLIVRPEKPGTKHQKLTAIASSKAIGVKI
jgi:nucleotide-binding universal stress UspA family protein